MRKTKEQKEIAVKRYLSGESATAITTGMGMSRSALYLLVKQFREAQKDKGNVISVVCSIRQFGDGKFFCVYEKRRVV